MPSTVAFFVKFSGQMFCDSPKNVTPLSAPLRSANKKQH